MYESGYGSFAISKRLGFTKAKVRYWIHQYRERGEEGLKPQYYQRYSSDFKINVVHNN